MPANKSGFFVRDGRLYTQEKGREIQVEKLQRFTPKGEEVTPLVPHIVGQHLVLMDGRRPVNISFIYSTGEVKELFVSDEYRYEISSPKKKRPPKKRPP
jgi:hypothetical protein